MNNMQSQGQQQQQQQQREEQYDDEILSLQGSNRQLTTAARTGDVGQMLGTSQAILGAGIGDRGPAGAAYLGESIVEDGSSHRGAMSGTNSTPTRIRTTDSVLGGSTSTNQVEWGRRVDKRVRRMREYLLFLLIGATLFISLTIYYTIFFNQVNQFEDQFTSISVQYLDRIQEQFESTITVLTTIGESHTITTPTANLNGDVDVDVDVSSTQTDQQRDRRLDSTLKASNTYPQDWPFRIVPGQDWPVIAASTLSIGDFGWTAIVPVIPNNDTVRAQYEAYVEETKSAWMPPTQAYNQRIIRQWRQTFLGNEDIPEGQQQPPNFSNAIFNSKTLTDQQASRNSTVNAIFEHEPDDPDYYRVQPPQTGPYYPIHQSYPLAPINLNYNLMSHEVYGKELQVALELFKRQQHIYTMYVGTLTEATGVGPRDRPNAKGETRKNLNYQGLKLRQPASMFFVPIKAGLRTATEGILDSDSTDDDDDGETTPDAIWIAKFRWIPMLQPRSFSEKAEGMQIVLVHNCRGYETDSESGKMKEVVEQLSTTTFQVNEDLGVEWLGFGDLHKSTLNYLEESAVLRQPILRRTPDAFRTLSSTMEGCAQFEYELRLYPSQKMKDNFFNLAPIGYTVLVLVVFAVTSLIFIGYDYYVDRRQRLVMQSAERHHAIVSSLFPKRIRERLFKSVDVEVTSSRRRAQSGEAIPAEVTDNSIHGRMLTQRARLRSALAAAAPTLTAPPKGNEKSESNDSEGHSFYNDASLSGGNHDDKDGDTGTHSEDGASKHAMMSNASTHSRLLRPGRSLVKSFLGGGNKDSTWAKGASSHQRVTFLGSGMGASTHSRRSGSGSTAMAQSSAIADLFTQTTVLFADIDGFTAWSSSREPTQVFILLETVYGEFDTLADKRDVFKVETIGDSYVAVTGLPDPQPNHAVIMTRFAYEMQVQMTSVTRELVVELGPDTADLSLRVGLHSGPVIAGVLRGQKSRFQLFGDTVNTAARMESTGKSHHIQCSKSTAEALEDSGKSQWLIPREDMVMAKGKGAMQTFWVDPRGYRRKRSKRSMKKPSPQHSGQNSTDGNTAATDTDRRDSIRSSNSTGDVETTASPPSFADGASIQSQRSSNADTDRDDADDDKFMQDDDGSSRGGMSSSRDKYGRRKKASRSADFERHLDWNVDLLSRLLKSVIARQKNRGSFQVKNSNKPQVKKLFNLSMSTHNSEASILEDDIHEFSLRLPREEYAECIHLPQYHHKKPAKGQQQDISADSIQIDKVVQDELRDYVTKIACSYHSNPFHNYDHATHVTMSANKILNRVVAAEDMNINMKHHRRLSLDAVRHDYTYGITSDPLTHFACVFSAMIHDVDHPGVSNAQLVKEEDEMAMLYGQKSVAEQNSVDLAWNLLMDPAYRNLRNAMFIGEEERKRFRQLLVNSVMATDIFDPELVAKRNRRWEKAFASSSGSTVSSSSNDEDHKGEEHQSSADLRATIVIEHIIQAADVSHTMQHWHVYQKWNRRLFNEMYRAYKTGRLENDPSKGWYKGELWFYDNYIIPLAKKLKDCGVFGVSSDEFLNYAMMNRSEWEVKGEQIVADLLASFEDNALKRTSSQDTIDA